MIKKLFVMAGLMLFSSQVYARDPNKWAQPTFEDPATAVSIYNVRVGTYTSTKLYMPDQNRDVRGIWFSNPSSLYRLFIATTSWNYATTIVNSTTTSPSTFMLEPSTHPVLSFMELSVKTTFYASFEIGGTTQTIRLRELWNDQSKTR